MTWDDASYVLYALPIISGNDQPQFDGRYRTSDIVLAYMNTLTSGDIVTAGNV